MTGYPRRLPVEVSQGKGAAGGKFLRIRPLVAPPVPLAPVVSLHAFEGADSFESMSSARVNTANATTATGRDVIVVHTGPSWGTNTPSAGDGVGQQAIDDALDACGYTSGKVCLRGVSMGGCHSLLWAAANPTRVQGVCAFVPALDFLYMWDGNLDLRASLEAAYGVTGRANLAAATADVDPSRNHDQYRSFGHRMLILADDVDTTVGYESQRDFALDVGATFVHSSGGGHIAWPIGDAYDEYDQVRTWAA